jgi:two-component system, NarL family, response regulator DevR
VLPFERSPVSAGLSLPRSYRAPNARVRVAIVDSNVIYRAGVRAVLERRPGIAVVSECGDAPTALDQITNLEPDLAIVDVDLEDDTTAGLALLQDLQRQFPALRVLVLTTAVSELIVVEALRRGAAGYVLKRCSPDELGRMVLSVEAGATAFSPEVASVVARTVGGQMPVGVGLSDRELAVVRLVALGRSNKQVASELFISESTVKFHLRNAMRKLGATRRTEIAYRASQHGLV